MCVVSMVMDYKHDEWLRRLHEEQQKIVWPEHPWPAPAAPLITPQEVEEFRRLLERAREYDRRMNQPDCELDEKRKALKELARQLGVDIAFLVEVPSP